MSDLQDHIDLAAKGLADAKRAAETKTGLKGNTALAAALTASLPGKVSPQAISQWDKIPLSRVFDVERATGVAKEILRPDFFGESAA